MQVIISPAKRLTNLRLSGLYFEILMATRKQSIRKEGKPTICAFFSIPIRVHYKISDLWSSDAHVFHLLDNIPTARVFENGHSRALRSAGLLHDAEPGTYRICFQRHPGE